jgi:hypothetical protein
MPAVAARDAIQTIGLSKRLRPDSGAGSARPDCGSGRGLRPPGTERCRFRSSRLGASDAPDWAGAAGMICVSVLLASLGIADFDRCDLRG